MCIPDAASTMFRKVHVLFSLKPLREQWPPVSELAVASADYTHRTRNVTGFEPLRRSPSLLETVSPLVAGELSRRPS